MTIKINYNPFTPQFICAVYQNKNLTHKHLGEHQLVLHCPTPTTMVIKKKFAMQNLICKNLDYIELRKWQELQSRDVKG